MFPCASVHRKLNSACRIHQLRSSCKRSAKRLCGLIRPVHLCQQAGRREVGADHQLTHANIAPKQRTGRPAAKLSPNERDLQARKIGDTEANQNRSVSLSLPITAPFLLRTKAFPKNRSNDVKLASVHSMLRCGIVLAHAQSINSTITNHAAVAMENNRIRMEIPQW